MHLIELLPNTPLEMPAGKYLCENINAGEFLAREWCHVYAPEAVGYKAFSPKEDWNHRRILFVRPGGYGDLLFLTPTFRELKRRWPQVKIKIACFDHYFDVYRENPDIDGIVKYPVDMAAWNTFDAHVWLENALERNPDALTTHAIDLFAGKLGLEPEDKTIRYELTMDERLTALERYPRRNTNWDTKKMPRVGIQAAASSVSRNYPHTDQVAATLYKAGWEVFLFGAPGSIQCNVPPGITNFTRLPVDTEKGWRGADFRESCAALATCDVCIAPDSALCHVAGALGVPTVALYGPFPWKLRTAYAPSIFALSGHGECAPCFHHQRAGIVFPAGKPCSRTGRCEVLASIDPDRVVAEVEKRRPVENLIEMAKV